MFRPPLTMSIPMQALTNAIRSPTEQGIQACRYREFIRNNIFSVITNTFPLFCAQFTEENLYVLTDEWLKTHCATEPEFHQIATEFVQFIQQRDSDASSISPSAWQIALLEYEWIIFSTEIDITDWSVSKVCWDDVEARQDVFGIQLNPTLRLVEVPFLVHPKSVTFLTQKRKTVCYGVFRNTSHHVVSQKLREVDIALIQMIQNTPTLSLAQLQQQVDQHLSAFHFWEWVQLFQQKGLITPYLLLGETQ